MEQRGQNYIVESHKLCKESPQPWPLMSLHLVNERDLTQLSEV